MKKIILLFTFFYISLSSIAQITPCAVKGMWTLCSDKGDPITETAYDTILSLTEKREVYEQEKYKSTRELIFYLAYSGGRVISESYADSLYQVSGYFNDQEAHFDTIIQAIVKLNWVSLAGGTVDVFNREGNIICKNLSGLMIYTEVVESSGLQYMESEWGITYSYDMYQYDIFQQKAGSVEYFPHCKEGLSSLINGFDYLIVKKDEKWGIINFSGQEIIPAAFDTLELVSCNQEERVLAVKDQHVYLFSLNGDEVNLELKKEDHENFFNLTSIRNRSILKILIEQGADINRIIYENEKTSLLRKAVLQNDIAYSKFLLTLGARTDLTYEGNKTVLMDALANPKNSSLELVRLLIKYGAKVNDKDEWGKTALHHAVGAGNLDLVRFLLESGSLVDEKDNNGQTSLHYSVFDIDVVRLLLATNANPNEQDLEGRTPLHLIIIDSIQYLPTGLDDVAEYINVLLNAGANKKITDNYGKTALDYAQ